MLTLALDAIAEMALIDISSIQRKAWELPDMEHKLIWKQQTGTYSTGWNCYIGKIKVGSADYSLVIGGEYRAYITLPGIRLKDDSINFLTLDAAKLRVEQAVKTWFEWLEQE